MYTDKKMFSDYQGQHLFYRKRCLWKCDL